MIENFLRNKVILWINQILQQNINEENIRAGVRLLALCTNKWTSTKIPANDQKNRDFLFF